MRGWPGSSPEPAASLNTPFKPAARPTVQDRRTAISAADSNAYWLASHASNGLPQWLLGKTEYRIVGIGPFVS